MKEPQEFTDEHGHLAEDKRMTKEEFDAIMDRAMRRGSIRVIDIPMGPMLWPEGMGDIK